MEDEKGILLKSGAVPAAVSHEIFSIRMPLPHEGEKAAK
jgi:hypothetical protein